MTLANPLDRRELVEPSSIHADGNDWKPSAWTGDEVGWVGSHQASVMPVVQGGAENRVTAGDRPAREVSSACGCAESVVERRKVAGIELLERDVPQGREDFVPYDALDARTFSPARLPYESQCSSSSRTLTRTDGWPGLPSRSPKVSQPPAFGPRVERREQVAGKDSCYLAIVSCISGLARVVGAQGE